MLYSAALVAASGCLVSGHMLMKTPTPYTVNNSPLDPSGSNFPCKNTFTGATATGPNVMTIGAPQTLAFTGGATHGGGSCQISLTTDNPPTKATKWSVIHSIMGGCPTNTTDGNLSETDANMVDPSTFQYTIPEGISPGAYTLSLTWFNRVGNREMYQMCAPIQVNAASGSKRSLPKKRATSFPDMFKANIGAAGGSCATVTGDLIFPDPGDSVEYDRAGGASNPSLVHPAPGCASPTVAAAAAASAPPASGASSAPAGAAPSVATAGAGSGSGAAPSVAPVATSASAGAAPSVAPAGSSAASPSVAPVATSAPAGAAPSIAPAASSPAAAAPSAGAGTTTGTSGGLSGACTTEGTWNCIGGSSFQRCASGMWTAVQPMAAGTTCQTGQSQQLFA